MKTPSIPALETTQPPIPRVLVAFYAKLKGQESGVDHLPPSTVEVKSKWSYTSTPPTRLSHEEKDDFTCSQNSALLSHSRDQEIVSFHKT
jgi:hypothetical protein